MYLTICLTILLAFTHTQSPAPRTPAAAAAQLLEADRAFAAAAAGKPAGDAIAAMFAEDVTVPAQGNVFVQGKAKAREALASNPDNLTGRAEWTPVRAGISADGQHGFTFGYMTVTKADGGVVPLKYLAYWVKGADGWRVAAYRRRPRPAGEVSMEVVPPSLPAALVEPVTDPAVLRRHAESLTAAEKAFSDEAQTMGIGPAFEKHGRPDAVNMGGPDRPGFVVGSKAIGEDVGRGSAPGTSPVEWSADRVLVASSGDLGITFGMIRIKDPQPGGPKAVPFYTIWRRDAPNQPWRYIAE
jgi:ketosteroid isomerase-like protein